MVPVGNVLADFAPASGPGGEFGSIRVAESWRVNVPTRTITLRLDDEEAELVALLDNQTHERRRLRRSAGVTVRLLTVFLEAQSGLQADC